MKKNKVLDINNTPVDVVKCYLKAWQGRDLVQLLFSMQETFRQQYSAFNVATMFFNKSRQIENFKVIEEQIPERNTASVVQRDVLVEIEFKDMEPEKFLVVVNCEKQGEKPNAQGQMIPAYIPSPNGLWGVYPTHTFRKVKK